jgi:hypothetical protein
MKFKHNKKRNTAFLYEVLIKEMTKTILYKDEEKKNKISSVIKEFYSFNKPLGRELRIYRDLSETNAIDLYTAERLLHESRKDFESLDRKEIFNEQTILINKINKEIGRNIFNNFVPNYKNLASIYQIFLNKNTTKELILMERRLLSTMVSKRKNTKEKNMPHISNLALGSFVKNYNEKYSDSLLDEQRTLLNKYIVSFSDNGLELKSYLNEEIARLKVEIVKLLETDEIKSDKTMSARVEEVGSLLESFSFKKLDNGLIIKVLKVQNLIKKAQE